jgi:hypothetical protein
VLNGIDIKPEGIAELVKVLRKVEPELAKQLPREMRQAGKPLVEEARSLLPQPSPLSGWGAWNNGGRDRSWTRKAKSGIRITTNTGARKGVHVINLMALESKDPAAAIYENAGRHRKGSITSSDASDRFLAALEDKHGAAPRFLWPAVEINIPKLNRELQQVIERWSEQLEQKVDRF